MVDNRTSPLRRLTSHIPKNQGQVETGLKGLLKVVFWVALLAPVIIVPLYYLIVAIVQ